MAAKKRQFRANGQSARAWPDLVGRQWRSKRGPSRPAPDGWTLGAAPIHSGVLEMGTRALLCWLCLAPCAPLADTATLELSYRLCP